MRDQSMAVNDLSKHLHARASDWAIRKMGIPTAEGQEGRQGEPFFSYWLGKIGDAQVGPFYLGTFGLLSLICG